MNPGIGTKAAGFGNILYARARDGARLFFRAKDGVIEVLAKAYKGNEERVFRLLRELYGG